MHSDTVYTKTAKGVRETRSKHARLPRDIGLVFVAIDGRTSVADLEAKSTISAERLHEALEKLAEEGFIKPVGAADTQKRDALDLDFTTPEALATLNAEAATRTLAEADANTRAQNERRAALDAKLKEEAEARARALAEMRAQAEAEARQQAEEAADTAKQARIKAELDLEAAPDRESRAEAEARMRTAAAAIARAQAEARVRADAENQARAIAEQKRAAETEARQESELRERAGDAALAQAAAEAKAREAIEAQIRDIQSGGTGRPAAPPPAEPPPQTDVPEIGTVEARTQPSVRLIDPFEVQQQAARLRLAEDADRRESGEAPPLEINDEAQPVDSRAAGLQARVQAEIQSREQARAEGDRALGTHAEPKGKLPEVDIDLGRSQHAEPARQPPAFARGSDKPSEGLMRAVTQAAALVKAAEASEAAEAKAPADDDALPAPEEEERVNVDRAAYDIIAEQAAARARERASATDAARIAERQRRQQEDAKRAEIFEKLRRRKAFIRGSAASAAVLLIALGAFLQFVPLTPFIPGVEQEIAARLKEPVSIGSMRYPLLPRPRVVLENVVIGRGIIKADELSVPGLPFASSVYDRVEGRGVTIDPVVLGALPAWATTVNPAGVRLERLQLTGVKLTPAPVDLGALDADVRFAANGTVTTATLKNEKATLILKPLQEQVRFSLSAHDWQIPLGPALAFAYLDVEGTANRTQLVSDNFQGRIAGGAVTGTILAKFSKPITAQGTFRIENARLQEVMPAFTPHMPIGGLLRADGRYTLQADDIKGIFDAPQVDATFSIARGDFRSIDIVRTVQASSGRAFRGGRTPFDDLSGALRVANGAYAYRQLTLSSGALNATGNVEVARNGVIAGHVTSEVGAKGRVVARSTVVLSGTLKDPAIRQ